MTTWIVRENCSWQRRKFIHIRAIRSLWCADTCPVPPDSVSTSPGILPGISIPRILRLGTVAVWQLRSSGRVTRGSLWAGADWQRLGLVLSSPAKLREPHKANHTNPSIPAEWLFPASLWPLPLILFTPPDQNCYGPHSKLLLVFPCVFQEYHMPSLFLPLRILTLTLRFLCTFLRFFIGLMVQLALA